MGWTSYHATEYRNGKVDRKAECDKIYTWEDSSRKCEVVKSAMVGSTYYAAVRCTDKANGTQTIMGTTVMTSGSKNDYYNFRYKPVDETMGPGNIKCPLSILDVLSPTDSQWANEWREECREYHRKNSLLRSAKEGATFRVHLHKGFSAPYGGNDFIAKKTFRRTWDGGRKTVWVLVDGHDAHIKESDVLRCLVEEPASKEA